VAETLSFGIDVRDNGSAILDQFADHVQSAAKVMDGVAARAAGDLRDSLSSMDQAVRSLPPHVDRVSDALQAQGKAAQQAQGDSGRLSKAWDGLKTGLAATAGVLTGAVTGLAALTLQVTGNATEVEGLSRKLGVTTEFLSKMGFAAKQQGIDFDSLREGLQTAQEALVDAASGTSEAGEAIKLLGIQATDASGRVRSIEEVMPELADALSGVSNQSDRFALALKIFGEEESKLLQVLDRGSQGLNAYGQQAEKLGVVVGGDLVKNSREFRSGLTSVQTAVQGLANHVVAQLLPSLNDMLPRFIDFTVQLKDSSLVTQTLIPLLQGTVEVLSTMSQHLGLVEKGWNLVNAGFNLVLSALTTGMAWLTKGLSSIVDLLSQAAAWAGLEGMAASMQRAAEAGQQTANEMFKLRDVIAETGQEWLARDTSIAQSQQAVQAATRTTGDTALAAGQQAAQAQEGVQGAVTRTTGSVFALQKAYADLGMTSARDLKAAATQGIQSFNALAQAGSETPRRLLKIWEDEVRPRLIAVFGDLPEEYRKQDAELRAAAAATALSMTEAFEQFGLNTTGDLRRTADEAIKTFQQIRQSGQATPQDIVAAWDQAKDAIIAAYGKIPPEVAALNNEMVFSIKNSFKELGVSTDAELNTLAGNALRHFENIRSSGEVSARRQAEIWQAEIVPAIMDAYGKIPPHLQTLHDRMTASAAAAGEAMVAVHGQAAAAISRQYETAAERAASLHESIKRMLDSTGLPGPGQTFFAPFATDLAGLQRQLDDYKAKMMDLNRMGDPMGATGYTSAQGKVLTQQMAEIERRMAALRQDQGGTTSGTAPATTSARTTTSTVTGTGGSSLFVGGTSGSGSTSGMLGVAPRTTVPAGTGGVPRETVVASRTVQVQVSAINVSTDRPIDHRSLTTALLPYLRDAIRRGELRL
jgi:hypothetical protein